MMKYNCIPPEWQKLKYLTPPSVVEQQNFHMLWLEVKTGTNTLENNTDHPCNDHSPCHTC